MKDSPASAQGFPQAEGLSWCLPIDAWIPVRIPPFLNIQTVRPLPEVHLTIQWPDGRTTALYSPSRVILETLSPGRRLTVEELRHQGREALRRASERVRQRYGFACTRADEEEHRLLETAATYSPEGMVSILEG